LTRLPILIIRLLFFILLFLSQEGIAQNRKPSLVDSTKKVVRKSALNTAGIDTTKKGATPTQASIIDTEAPNISVHLSAKDSLLIKLKDGRTANLFGAASVEHESGSLKSGKIALDFDTNIMSAEAISEEDTLSHPVLTRGKDELRSQKVLFNYKTEQGKFHVARMKYNEGNLIGTDVKNKTKKVVFVGDGIYSTCELDHPHYYIKAKKMKVVDEEEIFFTNAMLYLLDIPYPLILPFGYVPAKMSQKQSGLIAPSYAFQNVDNRGLGLQNLGWFQYVNDYVTTKITASFFTSGSYNTDADANYAIRDKLSGSIRIGYSRLQGMEPTDPSFSSTITSSLGIRHNQTINPYSRFDVNLTLRSAQYNKNVSFDIEERAEVSTNSTIGYQYSHPENLYNFNITANQSQNFANNSVTIGGPNASLGFKSFSPFQKAPGQASGQAGPLESLTINIISSLQSNYQFTPIDRDSATISWLDALLDGDKYREATGSKIPIRWGVTHNASITSRLLPSEFVNVLASMNYREYWHPYTIEAFYDTSKKASNFNIQNGFASARDFSVSLNMNTKLYGIANANLGSLKSLRHTLMPSLTFSYTPNFQSSFWGYYDTYQVTSSTGVVTDVNYSRFQEGINGQQFSMESRILSFSLNNVLEAKTVHRDTLGEKKERIIKLIDSWNISTGYNFMAEQFKLSPLTMRLSSSIINNLNLNASANFTFYASDSAGSLIDRYLWDTQKKPMSLTSFSFNAGSRFSSGRMTKPINQPYYYPETYDPLNQQDFLPQNPLYYQMDQIDYSVPWSVSLNFSYSWSKNRNTVTKKAILNASSIQINPTPKWNISTQIGYDFIQKKLTPNQIRVSRNLHCWDMSFMWNPFSGAGKSYYLFRLSVNNQQFQSLFQKLPGLNNLERNSSGRTSRPVGF
jgi:hypothetical protein